jgi:hypothetical protein
LCSPHEKKKSEKNVFTSVADPDPMLGKSPIRNEHSRSFYTELRNSFLGLEFLLTFFDSDPGSGINIPDPQHWF